MTLWLLNATLNCKAQQAQLIAQNALFNGLAAGIGAGINHKPFVPAFLVGAGCGVANFYAKKEIANAPIVGKVVDAISMNVVQNLSQGIPVFSRVSLPIGFLQVQYDKEGMNAYMRPFAVIGAIDAMNKGYSFNAKESAKMCAFVFTSTGSKSFTTFNAVCIGTGVEALRLRQVKIHESVHAMQHNELSAVMPLQPLTKYHIWLDMPISSLLYELQPYHNNAFESESYFIGEGLNY